MKYQIRILPSGKIVEVDSERVLTKENIISEMESGLRDRAVNYDSLLQASFYMEYAISTGDMGIVQKVHDKINSFIIDAYHVLDKYHK